MHLCTFAKASLFFILATFFYLPFAGAQPAPTADWVYGTSGRDDLQQLLPTDDGGFILLSSVNVGMEEDVTDTLEGEIDIWVAKGDASGNIVWDEVLGGSKNEYPVEIVVTADGGYLILASSFSDMSGDKSEDNRAEEANNIWIIKIDGQGQKVWDKTYGTAASEDPKSIIALPDGSFVIASDSQYGIVEFERTALGIGDSDPWLLRIDENGNALWDKTLGARSRDNVRDLLFSADGSIVLLGYTFSFDDGITTAVREGAGLAVWMVKMNLDGQVIWEKRYDGLSIDTGYKIIQTNDGGYLVAAETYSGVGGAKTSPNFSNKDVWIIRTDSDGNAIWDKSFGSFFVDHIKDVIALPNGHFLMGGTSLSEAGGTKVENNRGFHDYWVWEIDESGTVIWDKTFGGAGYDELVSLWWKGNGVFAIAGVSDSEIEYEKTKPALGDDDIWLLELSIQNNLCNYPSTPVSVCENAPIICDLNNYCSSTNALAQVTCPLPFCDDWILAENTNWHAFHAGAENITLRITSTNCTDIGGGIGIEAAIYSDCDVLSLVSNCWQESGEHTFDLVANSLIPDQLYYLMIDGIKGSLCDYSIEVVEGSTGLTQPEISVSSPVTGCFVDELILENNLVTSDGATQFLWTTTDGKLLNGAITLTPTVATSGTYLLTAKKIAGVCTSLPSNAEVLVESKAIKANFEINGCSNEITLNASNSILSQGADFSWIPSAGGTLINDANTLTPTAINEGTYTLNISLDDCETSQTINLPEDAPVPQISIAPYPELECYDNDIEIDATASTSAPQFDYYWDSPTGGRFFSFFLNPLEAEVDDAGTYSLVIRNRETGCQDSTSFDVMRNAPYLNTYPYWDEISCDGTPSTLGIGVYPEGVFNLEYEEWTTTNGNFVTATDIPNPQVDAPGWYSGGITDLNTGCISFFGFQVYETEIDSIIITPMGELSCINETMTLDAYDDPFFKPYDFSWSTNNGLIVAGEDEQEVTIGAGGTYYIEITYKGCLEIDSITVPNISAAPSITFNNPYSLDCNTTELTLEIEETYPDSSFCFWWETADGHFSSPPNQLGLTVDEAGTYQLRVTNLKTGCFNENTVVVTGSSEQPTAEALPMAEIICGQENIELDATNSSQGTNFSYEWSTANGLITNGSQTLTPTVNTAGNYTLTVTNSNGGCTSTATVIVLDNRYTAETTVDIAICEGMDYSIGSSVYSTTGIYQDTLLNFENCDSIIHTQLTVLSASETFQALTICDNEIVTIGNETFSETGSYSVVLTNSVGCDSTIALDLMVAPTQTTALNAQLCAGETMMVGDETFSETGNYSIVLINSMGCDSTIELDLIVPPTETTTLDLQLCAGESIQIGNESFSETGNYQVNLTNSLGCDSLVNLGLEIVDNYLVNLNEVICPGESLEIGGVIFDATGTYEIPLVSTTGCDSLINLDLTVGATYDEAIDAMICAGETFILAGNEFVETGNYQVLLTSSMGCDSLLNLDLLVMDIPMTNTTVAICEGDSYDFGNEVLTESGSYADTLATSLGCDSVLVLDLTVVPELLLSDTLIFDDTGSSNGSIEPIITGGLPPYTYDWSNGEITPTIDNLATGTYELTVTDSMDCELMVTFFVNNLNAVNNHPFVQQFQIAPNPSNGNFDIFLQLTNVKDWAISLYRVNGQLVKEWSGVQNGSATEIKVDNLAVGVYFVHLQIRKEIFVTKVIVAR